MGISYHSMMILEDGAVKSCGYNAQGQLGIGSIAQQYSPVTVPITGVKQISCGGNHTFFLLEDGTVKSCGYNAQGQLGIGNTADKNSPVTVPIENVKQISCGGNYTFFLFEDGTVKSCGQNNNGQLGIGNTTQQNSPVTVPVENVKQISCGANHTFFLFEDGTVKSCGENDNGQLGIGNTIQQNSPITVPVADVKQISCGAYHTFFLLEDGTVKACGYNYYGQLGIGNTAQQNSPVTVPITGVKQISCGGYHTFFLLDDGTIKSCGRNDYGQLGIGNNTEQNSPITVPITNVKQISCGYAHTFFLLEDGTVKACGYNGFGQIGIGSTTHQYSPVTVSIENVSSLWDIQELIKLLQKYLLIYHNNKYKRYQNGWSEVDTVSPTADDFLKGNKINELKDIPAHAWYELLGEIEILYYTDDPQETEAKLGITANYSPIDEFEDEFKIVTWSNQDKDLQVNIDAIPKGQFIVQEEDLDISYIESFKLEATQAVDAILRILASFDSGMTWTSYVDGIWKVINHADHEEVAKEGILIDTFNAIEDWKSAAINNTVRFAYYMKINKSADEVSLDKFSYTTEALTSSTPLLKGISINYEEITLEGRLKDLERINAINLAKLNFKANSLLLSDKYNMHDMVIDTMESDEMITVDNFNQTLYNIINKNYQGIGSIQTEKEMLPSIRKQLLLNADHTGCTFKYSLDSGTTWHDIQPTELKDISKQEGNELIIQVNLPTESATLSALSYSWV